MYAVYNYAAGASQANVLADLVNILTGTTDKTLLSAACVQANTSILSTVAAGWAVYDASAGTNIQCIRALNQDGSTYKYYELQVGSTTAISGQLSESWNASTHVGTNNTGYSASAWSSSGGGYFYIYATAKNICIMPWIPSAYQAVTGLMVCELSRDTIPSGYPSGVICNAGGQIGWQGGASNASIPRVKNQTSAGDTTAVAVASMGPAYWGRGNGSYSVTNLSTYRDASENPYLPAFKVGCAYGGAAQDMHLGLAYDLYLTGGAAGSTLDEISYSGTTYVLFKPAGAASSVTILVPKA